MDDRDQLVPFCYYVHNANALSFGSVLHRGYYEMLRIEFFVPILLVFISESLYLSEIVDLQGNLFDTLIAKKLENAA